MKYFLIVLVIVFAITPVFAQENSQVLSTEKILFDVIANESIIQPNASSPDYSDPAYVNDGRINYSDPVFENMVPSHICNCIAFRFDDIQNNWLPDVQFEILKTFREKNVPITIDIIGASLEGEIANYLRNATSSENSNLEIANHGWTHENFRVLDKDQQNLLIKKSNERIFNVTGIMPETFVPPMGEINESIFEVLQENNFTTFSGLLANSPPPYPRETLGIHQFPETALTAVFLQDSRVFQGISHKETLKDIGQSQKKFGFSVIAVHPQDFALMENGAYVNKVNHDQIQELVLLIEEIQKSDLEIVFLNQISENLKPVENQEIESLKSQSIANKSSSKSVNEGSSLELDVDSENTTAVKSTQKIPDWIKSIFIWYGTGEVSETELLNSIKFLITEEIIKLD